MPRPPSERSIAPGTFHQKVHSRGLRTGGVFSFFHAAAVLACSWPIIQLLMVRPTMHSTSSITPAATQEGCRRDHLRDPIDERRPLRQDRLVVEVTLQVGGQFPGRGVAVGRILADRLEDDRFQLDGNRSFPGPRGGRGSSLVIW